MKTLYGICLGLFVLACAGEPASPPEMTNQERGEIQAQALEWSDQFLDNLNHLDAHGVATLFDEADAHFANGADYQPSWQAFSTGTQELYREWESWSGQWESRRVDVLAPDAALVVGQVTGTMTTADGTEYDVRPLFSFVLRKNEDGGWSGLFGQVASERTPRDGG
jgi:ketosteroid isomerase-like protein